MTTTKAARKTRPPVTLNPIQPRLSAEAAYRRIIVGILNEAWKSRPDILTGAIELRGELTVDGPRWDAAMRSFRATLAYLTNAAQAMINRLLTVEQVRHDKKWVEQVNAAIGVDLTAVLAQETIAPHIDAATNTGVALIRGLTEEVAKRVEVILTDLVGKGASNAAIAKAFSDAFGWGKKRAAFIARDQVATFNGNLNRIRQQQAGVTEYIWWTVHDERVRGNPDGKYPSAKPSHWARHGQKFKWSDPPDDGHPGQPINCRCIARPVL